MKISPRFRSSGYDTSLGSGKILHVPGSEDKMLKLSSKICLVLALNGQSDKQVDSRSDIRIDRQ